jgi:hypothetical protein
MNITLITWKVACKCRRLESSHGRGVSNGEPQNSNITSSIAAFEQFQGLLPNTRLIDTNSRRLIQEIESNYSNYRTNIATSSEFMIGPRWDDVRMFYTSMQPMQPMQPMQLAEPFPDVVSPHFVRRMVIRLWMPFSDTQVAPDQIHAFFSENMQQDGLVSVCLLPGTGLLYLVWCIYSGNEPWVTACYQQDVETVPHGRRVFLLHSHNIGRPWEENCYQL